MIKRRPGVILVLVFALVMWGAVVVRLIGNEATGTVTPPKSTVDAVQEPAKRITIEHELVLFSYGADYGRATSEKAALPVEARFNLVKHQQFSTLQIAVTVTRLETGSLSDDGTYNFREKSPTRFIKKQRTVGQHRVIEFTDTSSDAFSKVVYLYNARHSASIAMSSTTVTDSDALQADLDAVTASWQWR